MKENQTYLIKVFVAILVLIISVGVEFAYREPLFSKTLEVAEKWQTNSPKVKGFFLFVSETGTAPVLLPMLLITIFWLPLNKSYTFLCVLIYSYYFDNVMKVMYGNYRPYWVKPTLFIQCNGGYGNPSGHSFSSASVYTAFCHLVTDYKWFKETKLGIATRICLFVLSTVWVILILLSRIYLGAHSINQVLYGSNLGLVLYFIIFFVMCWPSMDSQKFSNMFKQRSMIIAYSAWYVFLIVLGFLCWGLIDNHQEVYEPTMNLLCPDLNEYRKFNADGLFGVLSVFGIIGGHYGLMFLIFMMDKYFPNKFEEINHWYRGRFLNHIYRILICVLFGLPLILTFVIPSDSSMPVIYVFKVSVPYLDGVFNIYAFAVYFCVMWKIANPEIYNEANIIKAPDSIEVDQLRDSTDKEKDISNVIILKK